MRKKKLCGLAAWLAAAGLVVGACAPAAAPAPTKPVATAAPAAIAATVAPPTAAAAVGSPQPGSPAATARPASDQPRAGGVLTVSASVDPVNFDIHQEGTLGSLEPLVPAYDNLVQYDLRTWEIVGDLAERWELSPDGLSYTFYLRKGVKFHDGKPFSSEDVRYSLERQRTPSKTMRGARKEQFDSVDRFEAPDENTFRIVMKQPYVAFLPEFATDWFVIMPKHVIEAKGDMKKDILGTGPFKLKSYSSGVSIDLVKNPDYFVKGLPYLDGITHYIIRDGATRFSAFRTGRVKMTGHWASLTPTEASTTKAENAQLALWRFPGLQSPWYVFNAARPPFNDARVRRAVSLAFDRQAAIKVLAEGEAKLGTFLPPGQWGLPEQDILKLPGYRQPKDADRAEARKLLAEAGFPDGLRVPLLVRAVRLDQKSGEFMKDQLASIGINASIEVAETAVYNTRTRGGDFQLGTQQSIWKINDPDEMARKLGSGGDQNLGRWSVKKFDDLFAEQLRAMDATKRKAIVRELDEIVLQEWPSIFPYWSDTILGTWPEVKNFAAPPGLFASMRLTDIWLAK